ncbi:hypothetical protein MMC10_001730 [Thelotrema lepadinum]|nr:hypothetical protein [Thelotrema lepadinum]
MQQSIPFEALPATFRDAIAVVRRLGYRYLWIDSLCIVQDSKDDWASESIRMQHYYKYSVLTIAADDATGDHEGVLSAPRKSDTTLATIPFHTKRTKALCYISVRKTVEFPGQLPKSTHLSKRAWTLQEDLLAPRTLHFSSEYLAWECQGHRVTEMDLTPRVADDTELYLITKRFFLRPEASAGCAVVRNYPAYALQFEPLRRWYNILDEYLMRELSFEGDRPIAILGVAQEIQAQTGMTYLSGLWQEDLLLGLLWQVDGRGKRSGVGLRVPSWSWASVRIEYAWSQEVYSLAEIHYNARQLGLASEKSFRAEVLGVEEVSVVDSSSEAMASDQSISLRGRVLPLSDWAGKSRPFYRSYRRKLLSHTAFPPAQKPQQNDMLICIFDEDLGGQNSMEEGPQTKAEDAGKFPRGGDAVMWNEEACKGVIMLQITGSLKRLDLLILYGLLLKPVDESRSVFRRVGLVEIPGVENLHVRGWEMRTVSIV